MRIEFWRREKSWDWFIYWDDVLVTHGSETNLDLAYKSATDAYVWLPR